VRSALKLSLRFDAAAMRRDLRNLGESDWIDHFVPQNYDGTWRVLPFRAPEGARHPIQTIYSDPACKSFVDTPLLGACPYFQQVLASFECPLLAVRLMSLAPGSLIKAHADHDLAAENHTVRFHIPVVTNPDVDFRLNGERVALGEGECWYLRLSDIHSVVNRGSSERIHLVLDALVTPWVDGRLMEAERSADREQIPALPAAISDLDRFRGEILRDLSLQERLREVEDREAFVSLAVQLAREAGYRTSAAEIDDAMRQARRRWWEPQ
jgi:hypothetical protein